MRKRKMAKNAEELQERYLALSGFSAPAYHVQIQIEAAIMTTAYLEEMVKVLRARRPKKPNQWARFLGAGLRAGKTTREVAAEWQALKSA